MAYYNELTGIVPPTVEERYWRPVVNFQAPVEEAPAGSPMWWTARLFAELSARRPLIQLYEDYVEGRHKLGLSTAEYRKVFGRALAPVSDPWMSLVVRASAERLEVQGFRMDQGTPDADRDAWRIWQANDLDEDAPLLFSEAIKLGESYLLVWKSRNAELPEITVEHPGQMIVARSPMNRRIITAALKYFGDVDGAPMATLYLPDRIVRMQWDPKRSRWAARDRGGEPAEERNPIGIVPVVPIVNDPQMLPAFPPAALLEAPHAVPAWAYVGLGRSDIADVITTQDQINKLLCDLLIASEFGAHRQRYMTGVEPPTETKTVVDDQGNEVEVQVAKPIEMGASRMVTVPAADARIGDLGATDLSNYIKPIEQRVQSIASRTNIPVHYLLGNQGNFPSGESLRAAETGLVAKTKGKWRPFGGGLERAMRIAFRWLDDDRQNAVGAEVDWKDPEYRTEAEHTDSLIKKLGLGYPPQKLWEEAGETPQEIDRMRGMIRKAAIEGQLVNPLALNDNGIDPETGA